MPVKIKPKDVSEMGFEEIKNELVMRLHDAALKYQADESAIAKKFFDAEKSVKDGDFENNIADEIADLARVNHASALRITALFDWLRDWKYSPENRLNGFLVKLEQMIEPEQLEVIDAVVVNESGLTEAEATRLAQLEFTIQKGIEGFAMLGAALSEVRDSGLYKAYGTFEEYLKVRWKITRARAYQLIDGSRVVNKLLTSGIDPDLLPANEAQARALAAVPEDRQAEVWQEARKDGKPSAAKVKAVSNALTPSPSLKGGDGDREIPPNPPYGKGGQDEWNPNLWETPRHIAKGIACLLREHEVDLLEPCAGTGMIARAIADIRYAVNWEYSLSAIEIRKDRAEKLVDNRYFSTDADFLELDLGDMRFDAVITNPPFDIGMKILERSLDLLRADGRCLFLLPIAYFQSQERAKAFAKLNAHIYRIYPIVGRVAYLKNGIPESGRQCEDAIFDIRLGADCDGGMEFIWQ